MGSWCSSTRKFSLTDEDNRPDEISQESQKLEALGDKLQRSITGLNSEEFDRNHQTLTRLIQELNELESVHKTTVSSSGLDLTGAAVRDASLSMDKMIEHLSTIYDTVNELQQKEKLYSAQNKGILRTVKSVNMKRMDKTLQVHEKLKGQIDTLLQNISHYKITGQNETKAKEIKSETLKLIPQMRKTADHIQETVNEVKHVQK
ncbi:uncharacterized protein LOC143736785 [Siphateles boraxobius]|uniref:uncharacterized protein LOC143736785 n=1 Tax=Siphateles boraxobius TaxID=180520 RepID=UPI0040634525